jgi:hypothetical protein
MLLKGNNQLHLLLFKLKKHFMKKFSFSMLAIVLAIGFAAFTTPPGKKNTTNNLYRYQLDSNTGMDDPANYLFTSSATGCGTDNNIVCIISAPGEAETGAHPDFELGTNPYSNSEGVTVEVEKSAP